MDSKRKDHGYPSDITREQFEIIRPILESARKKTKPRVLDLYDVFCGVLYILKSGCQWRMLPANFPKWRTCNEYFRIWSEKRNCEDSILDQILKNLYKRLESVTEEKKKLVFVSLTLKV